MYALYMLEAAADDTVEVLSATEEVRRRQEYGETDPAILASPGLTALSCRNE